MSVQCVVNDGPPFANITNDHKMAQTSAVCYSLTSVGAAVNSTVTDSEQNQHLANTLNLFGHLH